MGGHMHSHRPAEHRSRREIDQAIGVLIGIRQCSARQALEELAGATRVSGIGLGGVSLALLCVVGGDGNAGRPDAGAVEYWKSVLDLPIRPER
jgi:hypothetical protein